MSFHNNRQKYQESNQENVIWTSQEENLSKTTSCSRDLRGIACIWFLLAWIFHVPFHFLWFITVSPSENFILLILLKIGIYHSFLVPFFSPVAAPFQPKMVCHFKSGLVIFFNTLARQKSQPIKRIDCKWSEMSLLESNNDVACSEYFMRLAKVHFPCYYTERCSGKCESEHECHIVDV